MGDIITYLIIFVSTVISIALLGLAAGFSPTLYIAQIAITAKSKRQIAYAISIMSGVLAAILVLMILFQAFHLDTLLTFISTTVRAITLSVVFNVVVGAVFIFGGAWYLRHLDMPKVKPTKLKHAGGLTSVFGLGFLRTFVSISGVTATYIAGNIIANISGQYLERLIYSLVFFAATIIPFVAIVALMKKDPERLTFLTDRFRLTLQRFNYRMVVGVGAIIFGGSIVFFNVMMALLY